MYIYLNLIGAFDNWAKDNPIVLNTLNMNENP